MLDGFLARRHGATTVGAFLDPLADKVLVLGAMFFLVNSHVYWIVPVIIIAARELAISLYRTFVGAKGVSVPASKIAKFKTLAQQLSVGFAIAPQIGSLLARGERLASERLGTVEVAFVDRVGGVDGRGHADEHDRGDDVRPCRGVVRAGAPVPPQDGGDRLQVRHHPLHGVGPPTLPRFGRSIRYVCHPGVTLNVLLVVKVPSHRFVRFQLRVACDAPLRYMRIANRR
jgi:hypothetical protein